MLARNNFIWNQTDFNPLQVVKQAQITYSKVLNSCTNCMSMLDNPEDKHVLQPYQF